MTRATAGALATARPEAASVDPVTDGGSASPSTRERLVRWLPPVMVTVALQVWLAAANTVPSTDGMAYLEAGESLFAGDGLMRQGRPEVHFPPVGAVLLGSLEWLTGSEIAAVRVLDVVSVLVVVGLLALLAHRLSDDERVAAATVWIAGTAAGIGTAMHRTGGGTEAPTLALAIGATLATLGLLRPTASPRRRVALAAVAGTCCGAAYLTRPESLLPSAVLGVVVLLVGWRRHTGPLARLGPALVFAAMIAVAVVPYVAYLHGETGRWQLTSKAHTASADSWSATASGDRRVGDRQSYTTDGSRQTASLLSIVREEPGAWLGIVGRNAQELAYVYGGFSRGNPVPLLVPLLLVPAGWQAWRVRRDRASQIVLAVGLTAIVVSLGFLVLPRYLLGFTAVLAVFAVWGLVELHDRAHGWRRPALTAAVAIVLALAVLQGVVRPDAPGGTNDPTEQVAAGRWIAANTAPGSRIMTRSFAVQHYGERPVVALPAGTYDEVLDYARANGVRYLVADERTIRDRRPELAGPLLDGKPHPGLREVADLDEERGRVVIYALDPPPPESDRPTTPLGYIGD